jgi:hypothetical protein
MTNEGFILSDHAQGLIFGTDGDAVLDAMARWQAPAPKWLTEAPPG